MEYRIKNLEELAKFFDDMAALAVKNQVGEKRRVCELLAREAATWQRAAMAVRQTVIEAEGTDEQAA
jgi:hypothetical protein